MAGKQPHQGESESGSPQGRNCWDFRAGKHLDLGTTEDLDLAGKINNMRDYVADL